MSINGILKRIAGCSFEGHGKKQSCLKVYVGILASVSKQKKEARGENALDE